MKHVAAAILAATVFGGCSPLPHTRAAGAVTSFAVRPVIWNPAKADTGPITAVADAGNVVALFGAAGTTVLSSGAVVAKDTSITDWVGAQAIHGADGAAHWIVGIDGKGSVHYVRALSSLEDVSARYGLEGKRVRAVAMLDAKRVGFLLDGEIAVADGKRVTRYGAPGLTAFFGAAGFGAGISPDAVTFFDPTMTARVFALRGVTAAVVGADGRLYATTSRGLYAATERGDLALLYDAGGDSLHGLAVSGDHIWFADGTELGTIEGGHVAETAGLEIQRDAKLAPSGSGDVWVLGREGLRRYARAEPESAMAVHWSNTLAPVFARACASCHEPRGVSGTDLSTAEAWHAEKAAIRDRVVKTHTMPPQGHSLSEADRAAVEAWVNSPL